MRVVRELVFFKLGLIAGAMGAAAFVKRALPPGGDEESDELSLVAGVFDGIQLESRAQAFRGGSMLAWFGGIDLDLRDAELAPGARLTTNTLFGGIAIAVPPGWRVESDVRALAGGVDVRLPEPSEPAAPLLTLDGMALFGGVSVRAADDR